MFNKAKSVTVHQIPSQVTAVEARRFLQSLQPSVAGERPRLVLDCSEVHHMDDEIVHLLLCCLEAAMKSNGDVKIASIAPACEATLRNVQAHRLFEMYPTTTAAVQSFSSYFSLDFQPAAGMAIREEAAA